MPRVNNHIMRLHGILDLVNDRPSCCLDSKDLRNFNDVVRRGVFSDDTCCSQSVR